MCVCAYVLINALQVIHGASDLPEFLTGSSKKATCLRQPHAPPPLSRRRILTDIINSLQGFIVFVIFVTSRKKREIVSHSWEGTVSTVSQAARKLSRTDDTGVVWHVSDDQVCISHPEGSSSTSSKLTEELTPDLGERQDRGGGDGEASRAGETNPGFQKAD